MCISFPTCTTDLLTIKRLCYVACRQMSMYRSSLTNLLKLPKDEVKNFIDSFDAVLSDGDGVLWLQNKAIEGSPEVINRFKKLGKKSFLVTNNSTLMREEMHAKAQQLGFSYTKEEIISTSYVAANYLKRKNFNKTVYIVGEKGISGELDLVGIKHLGVGPDILHTSFAQFVDSVELVPNVGAVIVGFDRHISYPKLLKAASYVNTKGCYFIATNTDESFPVSTSIVAPGAGAIVQSVVTGAAKKPIIMGKPHPHIAEAIMEKHKIDPKRTIMLGDRCNTDILFGKRCGFQTLLVLCGVTPLKDVLRWKESKIKEEFELVPDVYVEKLGDLLPFLN